MKKIIILCLAFLILFTGCNGREEDIEDCENRGGNAKIVYCNDGGICHIECYIDKENNDE